MEAPPRPPASTSPTTVTTLPFPSPPVTPPGAVTAWLSLAVAAAARGCAAAGHAPCAESTPWGGSGGVCAGVDASRAGTTLFHGAAPPGVGVDAYVERLGEYGGVAPETWVLAVAYLVRLTGWGVDGRRLSDAGFEASLPRQSPSSATPSVPLNGLTVHRLVLAALLLAAKSHEDAHLSNGGWAVVGGVGVAELNGLELAVLDGLRYATAVRGGEYEAVRGGLRLGAGRASDKDTVEWRHDVPAPAAPAPVAAPGVWWHGAGAAAAPAASEEAAAPPSVERPQPPPTPAGGWSPVPAGGQWSPTPAGSPWVPHIGTAAAPWTPPPGVAPGWGMAGAAIAVAASGTSPPSSTGPIHSRAFGDDARRGGGGCVGRLASPAAIPAVAAAAAAVAAAGGSLVVATAASGTPPPPGRPSSRSSVGWPGGRGGRRRPPLPPSWSASHRQRPPRCGRTSPAFRKPVAGGGGGCPVTIGR
eukprot:TRINITY_DN3394_c0_g1_i7.p1 TRINITY_DN3394_c0_g1~~TRINITY_DN3394_c0_g1_i7.p1  ORF type:complete len:472 (-),score=80.01 TRINITY_DN3394_c0_g1_i7:741-2156(-)